MKVVGYIRVSTDGQVGEDRFGADAQREAIEKYCEANGYELLKIYADEGKSGAKEDRPELNQLVYGDVFNPPVEAVVVAASDRIARDINIYFYYKHELLRKGIKLVSIREDFGMYGSFAPVLEAFIVSMAQIEREKITERTAAGRKIKHSRGGYAGGQSPYGYTTVNGEYVVNEAEAEVVRAMFDMYYEEGLAFHEIARRLAALGIIGRRGAPVGFSFVRSVITNEKTYRGWYRYGTEDILDEDGNVRRDKNGQAYRRRLDNWVPGKHEPILCKVYGLTEKKVYTGEEIGESLSPRN